jgi:hypothetical protein
MPPTDKPIAETLTPPEPGANRNLRKFASIEVIGEMILLTAVAGFFIYIGVSARHWPFSAMLTPLIAVAIGTPFLIWRFVTVLRVGLAVTRDEASPQQIMDTGFRIGDDPKTEGQRFLRVFVALGVLYGGIWLLGFHIMVPLWVFVYMRWFGKVPLIWAALVALLFLGLMVGLYDHLLDALWHEPVLFKWLGINWFE